MFATAWDEGLDDAQLAAVEHTGSPLVIVAGAGTGKTRTLTARVARLLERGVPPERILLLTFTRRAAADMLARAGALAGRADLGRRLRGGTFHAVAHQLVNAWAQPLGLGDGFSVLDPADATDVMDLLRDEHGLSGTETRLPKPATLLDVYSRCVNTRRVVADVVANDFPWCEPHVDAISTLCRAYVARKRERSQLDFDDLLLYWRAALSDDDVAAELAGMFDHVLVDEYQDVNSLQVDIVLRLCPDGRGLTVVGDDAQAIYGFRGSDAAHLHDLADSLPGARVIHLERNFRSLQPVLDVANHVRPPSPSATDADEPPAHRLTLRASRQGGARPSFLRCHDAGSEARAVVERILEHHEQGVRLSEQAVLVRAAHHSDLIELELTARRVPYRKYGGLRFIETAHLKDFVAAARLLDNAADDIAWFRLLRLHEGIGPARARQLLETLPPRRATAPQAWEETVAAAPAQARVALTETMGALAAAREAAGAGARSERVVELLRPLLAARYTDAEARLNDLERLASAAALSDDLGAWLAEVTLDPPASTSDFAGPPHVDEDFVVVSTVHSAKGLEWRIVHLPHLVDGAFPSDMALRSSAGLAEEQRLFYVALTRARDELHLYAPLRMPHHRRAADDRHSLAQHSRWLDDTLLALVSVREQPPANKRITPPQIDLQTGEILARRGAVAAALELDALWQ
ncbi:MAG: UvrD/REP helicase [Acidimicrobiaceae bacterium]|nr:UvrD/REP helicase [Acidimicrobiaceae bacterium]